MLTSLPQALSARANGGATKLQVSPNREHSIHSQVEAESANYKCVWVGIALERKRQLERSNSGTISSSPLFFSFRFLTQFSLISGRVSEWASQRTKTMMMMMMMMVMMILAKSQRVGDERISSELIYRHKLERVWQLFWLVSPEASWFEESFGVSPHPRHHFQPPTSRMAAKLCQGAEEGPRRGDEESNPFFYFNYRSLQINRQLSTLKPARLTLELNKSSRRVKPLFSEPSKQVI